jgi:AAA family ATP:ADP antiporter
MHVYVLRHHNPLQQAVKEEKPRMSFRENIAYVAKSKYLLCVAGIVLAYNMVVNLTEVLWKAQLKALYPDPLHFASYSSKVALYIGLLATLGSMFISGNLIRRAGWKVTALVTPIVVVLTGFGFFYFLFYQSFSMSTSIFLMGMTPLALTVFFGSLQNIFLRASKYTVFDSTKEMAFIPLNEESKLKGKAAIDGIGSRLGKSGSSLVLQVLLIFFSTTLSCSPIILGIVLLILPVWMLSIHIVDKKFVALTAPQKNTN